jgi:hypothetical protein
MRIGLIKAKAAEQKLWDEEMAPILTGDEAADRLTIQKWIDENKFKPTVLYDGNSVVSKDKIIAELKRILKRGTLHPMSDYFYKFLTLDAGSIAHYSKSGWIGTYGDSADRLREFFLRNEFGKDIVGEQPGWKTDCIEIGKEILALVRERQAA